MGFSESGTDEEKADEIARKLFENTKGKELS